MAARRIITTACALALAASVLAACSGSSATTYNGTYLSLGDSVAAGNGASDKSSTSFVADLARHTALAAAAPAFEGEGATLTHVLDPHFDPHPNDAGHRAIADAFEAALRDMK